jgi:C_GCAxxG_C_C family probable redox protein
MTSPTEKAVAYFNQGYNCAQSVAAAYAEEFGLDLATVLKMTAGFGGGMGGQRETCGAVSAMVFIAGLRIGEYPPDDISAKKQLYALVKKVMHDFVEEHETTCCRQLLRNASCSSPPEPSERNAEYYRARPCARFVATAATIVSRSIPNGPAKAEAPR